MFKIVTFFVWIYGWSTFIGISNAEIRLFYFFIVKFLIEYSYLIKNKKGESWKNNKYFGKETSAADILSK